MNLQEFDYLLPILRSTIFTADVKAGEIHFKDRGWGHGVGMCQWGAYGMAKKGWDASQILSYYYPGSEIVIVQQHK